MDKSWGKAEEVRLPSILTQKHTFGLRSIDKEYRLENTEETFYELDKPNRKQEE
jgi:hypothetical protein